MNEEFDTLRREDDIQSSTFEKPQSEGKLQSSSIIITILIVALMGASILAAYFGGAYTELSKHVNNERPYFTESLKPKDKGHYENPSHFHDRDQDKDHKESNDTEEDSNNERPAIGIMVRDLTEEEHDYQIPDGVLIVQVLPNSGADEAGVPANSYIVAIDNQTVQTVDNLLSYLDLHKAGDIVELDVWVPDTESYGFHEEYYKVTLQEPDK